MSGCCFFSDLDVQSPVRSKLCPAAVYFSREADFATGEMECLSDGSKLYVKHADIFI